MVGLLPLCAATVFEGELLAKYPELGERLQRFLDARPELCAGDPRPAQAGRRRPPARLDPRRNQAPPRAGEDARRERVPQPVRHPLAVALSTPTTRTSFHAGGQEYRVSYLPAESDTGMFGGNSNWRGPIWMPVNAPDHPGAAAVLHLLRRRLHRRMSHRLRPADEPVPGRRGDRAPAREHLPARTRTAAGRSTAAREKFQDDPHWRDCLLFYEYFHGDNGAGLGASHQTGWTGVIARAMHLFATMHAGAGPRRRQDGLLRDSERRAGGAAVPTRIMPAIGEIADAQEIDST